MAEQKKKKCFVVMGFGLKTDFATGRTLDLDKTYQQIIKKAVEDAGLECIRADDIIHSGVIDKPMYELLFGADVVVADLSTSNVNAVYELGVRHALRPNTTIIIAEKQFKFPFDIGHIAIRPYEHLGKGIDEAEAERVRKDLTKAIMYLADRSDTDSPVYTFLPTLSMPVISEKTEIKPVAENTAPPAEDGTVSLLSELFMEAKKEEDWAGAIKLLNKLLVKRPNDVYVIQQLALATYKSKLPTLEEALAKAKSILENLNPYQTTDPETLGLWGAIHKRLWEIKQNAADLEESIWAYEKGFIVKNDFYNGINFAYLLNARASISEPRSAQADIVLAERVRKKVIVICNAILNKEALPRVSIEFIENEEQKFWLEATLAEAYFGIGENDKAEDLKNKISRSAPQSWMIKSMTEQLDKLKKFMEAVKA